MHTLEDCVNHKGFYLLSHIRANDRTHLDQFWTIKFLGSQGLEKFNNCKWNWWQLMKHLALLSVTCCDRLGKQLTGWNFIKFQHNGNKSVLTQFDNIKEINDEQGLYQSYYW